MWVFFCLREVSKCKLVHLRDYQTRMCWCIGSNCHGTSVAATEFCPTDLPRTEVLVAYCLPRKTQILTILPRKTAEILAKSVNLALLTERKLTICKQTSNFSTESLEKRAGFLKVQRSKHALIINLRAKIRCHGFSIEKVGSYVIYDSDIGHYVMLTHTYITPAYRNPYTKACVWIPHYDFQTPVGKNIWAWAGHPLAVSTLWPLVNH